MHFRIVSNKIWECARKIIDHRAPHANDYSVSRRTEVGFVHVRKRANMCVCVCKFDIQDVYSLFFFFHYYFSSAHEGTWRKGRPERWELGHMPKTRHPF